MLLKQIIASQLQLLRMLVKGNDLRRSSLRSEIYLPQNLYAQISANGDFDGTGASLHRCQVIYPMLNRAIITNDS